MDIAGARTLVVGATAVLGQALARALSGEGASLFLVGRNADTVGSLGEELGASTATWDAVDLDGAPGLVERAVEQLGGLDLLVVALGIAAFGSAQETEDVVTEQLLLVNTQAPIALVRAALPHLTGEQRNSPGAVAVLSAIIADYPTAQMASYSASKAALSAWLTALRAEQRGGGGATVFDVRPPHMKTGLADRAVAGTPPTMPSGADVDGVVQKILEGIRGGSRSLVTDVKSGDLSLT